MNSNIFKRDFKLPQFSVKKLAWAILLCLLPNIFFLAGAYFTKSARPLVNLDYVYAAFLLMILPARWRILGMIGVWIAVIFDSLMMIMQFFPFMNLEGALYLTPFIWNAPNLYKIFGIMIALYMFVFLPVSLLKIGKRTNFYHTIIIVAVFLLLGFLLDFRKYAHEREAEYFGRSNFYYVQGQVGLYFESQDNPFIQASLNTVPKFKPLEYDRAAKHLGENPSNKILFIVAESWGAAKNPKADEAILQNLSALKNTVLTDWQQGAFKDVGATVQGEMRELCHTAIEGFALSKIPTSEFAQCLPNVLRQKGYQTIAMHGASSQLYDRFSWYEKVGFQKTIFAENLIGMPTCTPFNGVCDKDLMGIVQKTFAEYHNKPLFFYWMTLTTHTPYSRDDVIDKNRYKCEQFGIDDDADVCGNFKLEAQFFDELAQLLQKPEMRGTQVIVVGDHPTPIVNLEQMYRYTDNEGKVSWVSFKVK